ncbi:MAG: ArsA family ATPase [Deltaproteobacteria bacterium]|nr:ArsA family ATPase [Deltaproteobacteria bacterium]MBW2388160.1 ArsA family ATPase [Deltaproteobacteria bacterium]MBW2723981.1 ArsA family ATPase [Deltaproteobacteria bacterium]
MTPADVPELLVHDRQIIVCVGTGGVGKTTVAAALALDAARRGRRTLVLTIDPARRLADALGIRELGNDPHRIATPNGESDLELYAMMLDPKLTFDGLIARFAPNEVVRQQILDNPIYEHVSGALAGSGEYAAMEKVLEMSESGRFDLVVVDTPPAQHVLEFLEAPRRLIEFLDSRLVKLLVHPAMAAGRFGVRLFQRPIQAVLQLLERVTGVGFLEDLSDFLMAIDDLSDGFKQRADRIQQTLLGDKTAFVLVAGPGRESSQNALLFLEHLDEIRASLQGVIINRMHLWPGATTPNPHLADGTVPQADLERLATALGDGAAARAAVATAGDYAREVQRDFENTRSLYNHAQQKGAFFRSVPELSQDVHDLESLSGIAAALVPDAEVADV